MIKDFTPLYHTGLFEEPVTTATLYYRVLDA
jgi:hypothetical protein